MSKTLPYEIAEPTFKFSLDEQNPNQHHYANIGVELGEPYGKYATKAVLDIETASYSGYELNVAVQQNFDSEWGEAKGINRIRIEITGDYEQDDLLRFLQQAGLLSLTVYGKMEAS